MDLSDLIRKPLKVKRIFKEKPSQDGFCTELENGSVVQISRTQWNTTDNKRAYGDLTIFTAVGSDIAFTQEQLDFVEVL